jgi:hypothetical protein
VLDGAYRSRVDAVRAIDHAGGVDVSKWVYPMTGWASRRGVFMRPGTTAAIAVLLVVIVGAMIVQLVLSR